MFYIISTNIDEFRADVSGEVRSVTSPNSYFFIIKNSLKVMNVQASQPSFKLVWDIFLYLFQIYSHPYRLLDTIFEHLLLPIPESRYINHKKYLKYLSKGPIVWEKLLHVFERTRRPYQKSHRSVPSFGKVVYSSTNKTLNYTTADLLS